MTESQSRPEQEPKPDELPEPKRVIDVAELLRGSREVWLELDGVRYRLRITRRNKLILQK